MLKQNKKICDVCEKNKKNKGFNQGVLINPSVCEIINIENLDRIIGNANGGFKSPTIQIPINSVPDDCIFMLEQIVSQNEEV